MIEGHGDDLYRYSGITMNFSSNIYARADLSRLEAYLCTRMDVIRSYPEPSAMTLERLIARQEGLDPGQVMVTSGAVDAIYLIAQTFRHLRTARVMHPTFSEYADACRVFGLDERPDGAMCWLCNPNNPTGHVTPVNDVLELAAEHQLLVVDQSYEDYTLAPLLRAADAMKHDNIVVLHSMTKRYAVPGLRLGYITAQAGIIDRLRSQYRPWAINALSLEAGQWLVEQRFQATAQLEPYLAETQRLRSLLDEVEGIDTADTLTNFFLCTIHPATAAQLKQHLAGECGILIRDASNFVGLTSHHFRIATQSPAENDALATAIRQFLNP